MIVIFTKIFIIIIILNDKHFRERFKDEFKKPSWFEEEYESDDELFDSNRKFIFQMFTNPLELQKYFEQQMQEILKSIRENEGNETMLQKKIFFCFDFI